MAYLEMRGITKKFGSVIANDHVDLSVERGEIHALLGENGAGKSTLMNVLYGMYDYYDGEVLLDGKPLHIKSPRDAIANGIGMVHQHFMLIPAHTVVENIPFYPSKPKGRPRKDDQPTKQDSQEKLERLRMENKLLRDFLLSTERKREMDTMFL